MKEKMPKMPKMGKAKAVPIAKAMPKAAPKMAKMVSAKKGLTPAKAKTRGKC